MDLKYRILLFVLPLLFGLGSLLIWHSRDLTTTRLIFCDVGQGDAILVTAGTRQVLIDGGPGTRVLDCLAKKMPFWDRTVEMVVLTHAQRDHMEGLIEVLARYQVKTIVTTGVINETDVFRAWEEAVRSEGASIHAPDVGDRFVISQSSLEVLWPFFADAPYGKPSIEEWRVNPPSDLNETSIVMRLEWDPSTGSGSTTCAYLTGDIPKEILQGLIDRECQILKVAHHGSKTGTSKEILEKAKPKVAVIQVGKNSFGHPTEEVLGLLQSKGIKILRNDTDGAVEIVSNGKGFSIKAEK